MSHTPDDIEVPETLTPIGVPFGNFVVFSALWVALAVLLLPFVNSGLAWATFLTGVAIGVSVMSEVIVIEPPDWHATVLFDSIFKSRRAVFQGLHQKLPWEKAEGEMVNLKREIPTREDTKFPLPTNDPAETMEVDLVVHTRLETGGTPKEDARRLIRYVSVEEADRAELIDGEIRKMFAGYYGNNEMENLLKADEVQKAVLADPGNHARIHELSEAYGVHIGVVLRSSNPDARTKKLKETPARAEAFRTAMDKLGNDLTPDEKRRTALLLDDTAEFSEHHLDIDLDTKGLDSLQHASLFVPPGMGGENKTGNKKGGGK